MGGYPKGRPLPPMTYHLLGRGELRGFLMTHSPSRMLVSGHEVGLPSSLITPELGVDAGAMAGRWGRFKLACGVVGRVR